MAWILDISKKRRQKVEKLKRLQEDKIFIKKALRVESAHSQTLMKFYQIFMEILRPDLNGTSIRQSMASMTHGDLWGGLSQTSVLDYHS